MAWREISSDPNAQACLEYRRKQLENAWFNDSRNRIEVVTDLCKGKKVVDFGCVDHTPDASDKPEWLHGKIATVAKSCVGVDFELEGVKHMQEMGYDVIYSNIENATKALVNHTPFEVVVAGEIIEHLSAPQTLLDVAKELLCPNGILIITTPNPYAPWRARAGQLRLTWESVDHVTYLFPSGMVELADRAGLYVKQVITVDSINSDDKFIKSLKRLIKSFWNRLLDVYPFMETRGKLKLPLSPTFISPLETLVLGWRKAWGQMGEYTIYVLEKPATN